MQCSNFNPRSLTGATVKTQAILFLSQKFQSTLPHGSDGCSKLIFIDLKNFNPRSLTGATMQIQGETAGLKISIHAPSRERLVAMDRSSNCIAISIHAPSRERHRKTLRRTKYYNISIHAPSRERPYYDTILLLEFLFQSTLPHGSDFIHFNLLIL